MWLRGAFALAVLFFASHARAADPARALTDADAWAALQPYDGPTADHPPTPTLAGKVMCGYQGWFNTPGDGSGLGWRHWGRDGRFEPGWCTVDLWPDVSDLTPAERVATPFTHADGSSAFVYSSENDTTVRRHFEWMRDYGIDGAFVQRFATETRSPTLLRNRNIVFNACRAGANQTNRAYAVMYDLSGLGEGQTQVVIDDWKRLIDRAKLTRDPRDAAYLMHEGKPVVALWGIGFGGDRKYTLEECGRLIDFFKTDPTYGGNVVMVGVPTYWRTLDRDSTRDATLLNVLAKADIISPWTVGRYATPEAARDYASTTLAGDIAWAKERKKAVMPVIFPGFSWHNMKRDSPSDQIPRRGGAFLWSQAVAAKRVGAGMLYVAMFDEVDEGTAVYKLAADPPTGVNAFLNEPGVEPDRYLWLTGQIGRMVRGEREAVEAPPVRD